MASRSCCCWLSSWWWCLWVMTTIGGVGLGVFEFCGARAAFYCRPAAVDGAAKTFFYLYRYIIVVAHNSIIIIMTESRSIRVTVNPSHRDQLVKWSNPSHWSNPSRRDQLVKWSNRVAVTNWSKGLGRGAVSGVWVWGGEIYVWV